MCLMYADVKSGKVLLKLIKLHGYDGSELNLQYIPVLEFNCKDYKGCLFLSFSLVFGHKVHCGTTLKCQCSSSTLFKHLSYYYFFAVLPRNVPF